MIVAVVVEAVALCVLTLLVVALLHAYAGLAARVERTTGGPRPPLPVPVAPPDQDDLLPAPASQVRALHGVTLRGEEVLVPLGGVGHDTLLAFLSSTCATCRPLWEGLGGDARAALGDAVRIVVVARGAERESPAALAALAPDDADVVCSSEAWRTWTVPGSPYFVLLEGAGARTVGEGTAVSWPQVASLLALSQDDAAISTAPLRGARGHEDRVDRVLRDAGILPGDPSLYPDAPAAQRARPGAPAR